MKNGNTNNDSNIAEDILSGTGVSPEKALVISKLVEEYTLQKVERINPVEVVKNNLERIEDIIKNQMTEGRHFGLQEGTSKKTLKLPGADLLLMNFSMRPSFSAPIITELADGHRDYLSTCFIYKFIDLENSLLVGEGSGSCSTREKKFRVRWTPINYSPTQDYWKLLREKKYAEARMCLPDGIESRKIGEKWLFCKQTENPDLADVYNTVFKMSRIRAKREAIQTLFAIAGAFDFIDPDDDDREKAEKLPDLKQMTEINQPKPEEKAREKQMKTSQKPSNGERFEWPHTFTDICSPEWYQTVLEAATSAEEIEAFMNEFASDIILLGPEIYKTIKEKAAVLYRKFKNH